MSNLFMMRGDVKFPDSSSSVTQHRLTGREGYDAQVRRRRRNTQREIVSPLCHLTEEELEEDLTQFHRLLPSDVDVGDLRRAAHVAKDLRLYYEVAVGRIPEEAAASLPVQLTTEEKRELRREYASPFNQNRIWVPFMVVCLAAFLQGHVQSSLNGATLYPEQIGLPDESDPRLGPKYQMGAANASPFLFAALLGCPLSLVVNHWLGRRGGMAISALAVFASTIVSPFATTPFQLFAIRIVNGIGMGLKAVSTPLLASEVSVTAWRGSSILLWQLWVAFGIMVGFACNFGFQAIEGSPRQFSADEIADQRRLAYSLILAAPAIPAFILFILVITVCDESPRYLMRRDGPRYDVAKAFKTLRKFRNTELQALRDCYLIHSSISQENYSERPEELPYTGLQANMKGPRPRGTRSVFAGFLRQYLDLSRDDRLRRALIAAGVVNLSQQLCGINILAFYSGTLFSRADEGATKSQAMGLSLGFGAVNFLFGILALKTIDTQGRRMWLLTTVPIMAFCLLAAALAFTDHDYPGKSGLIGFWLFLFAAAYSPGLGPIPFTLASESFPLSHRDSGASSAIAINLGFAGVLSLMCPALFNALGGAGTLGLFSGFNVVAFVLIFLLVPETAKLSLEDLDMIFAVSERDFMRFQVKEYLPWFTKYYIFFRRHLSKPSLYNDQIWGDPTLPTPMH